MMLHLAHGTTTGPSTALGHAEVEVFQKVPKLLFY